MECDHRVRVIAYSIALLRGTVDFKSNRQKVAYMIDQVSSARDVVQARAEIATAFSTDPLLRWIFPDDSTRAERTAAWLGLFVDAYAMSGIADITRDEAGNVIGVALWRVPSTAELIFPTQPTVKGLLQLFVSADRMKDIGAGLATFSTHRPVDPFAYLHFLVVAQQHRGRGLGAQLLRHGLARARERQLQTCLETTNETSAAFYLANGFILNETWKLGANGPEAWSLIFPNMA